jgi:hypothetical protein
MITEHVGVVTELALAARDRRPVLVSLARAGTPVGILMRRWALLRKEIELPHYSVSIVRGRGIDTVALDYIVARHDPRDVLFVDGWTGKGAIAAELTAALAGYAAAGGPSLSDDLAVIADPGCCRGFGTRQDILVPSACLNSTVCGLVSRTVLNDELIRPGMFHGAKVYSELAGADRSARFLDAVSGQFPRVAAAVAARWPAALAADRQVTFAGRAVVDRIQAEYGLASPHLVKPGAGEATRVLLRRLPWLVLVRPDCRDMLEHLLLLATERGGGGWTTRTCRTAASGWSGRRRERTSDMPGPVLITTDLDRTLIFSPRATCQLGGALPADAVEFSGGQTAGELCHAARDALAALPPHARLCVATSRSGAGWRAASFTARYSIASGGGRTGRRRAGIRGRPRRGAARRAAPCAAE